MKKGYITSYDRFFEAIGKGSKLVVVDNTVFDLSNNIPIHGNVPNVLEEVIGYSSLSIT